MERGSAAGAVVWYNRMYWTNCYARSNASGPMIDHAADVILVLIRGEQAGVSYLCNYLSFPMVHHRINLSKPR